MIRRPPRSTPFPTRRSSDLASATSARLILSAPERDAGRLPLLRAVELEVPPLMELEERGDEVRRERSAPRCSGRADRKSTRLNSSHLVISYAVFCLKKKKKQ